MIFRKLFITIIGVIFLLQVQNAQAESTADSLEQRVQNAIADGRVVQDLGSGFQQNPTGEFLLAPANKDLRYGLIIYNIDIGPNKAVFSAGVAFRDPHSNQLIAFKAEQVVFSFTHGLTGPASVFLVADVYSRLGNAVQIKFIGGNLLPCFAKFDCSGIKEFFVHAKAIFNGDFIQPVNDTGEIIANKPMEVELMASTRYWGDIIAQVSIPPFQIKGLKDFVFKVQNATIDLSEMANFSTMSFPHVYYTENLLGTRPEIWEGFYLEKGSVTLPKHFKQNNNKRLEIGLMNTFIDEFGFTGSLFGKNILSLEQGKIANWNISIDYVELNLELNQIKGGELQGLLGLPILPDTSHLGYHARIGINDNYLFSISSASNICIPAIKAAKIELYKNSFISIEIIEGKINLAAELSGNCVISAGQGENAPSFQFPKIEFEGLHLSNQKPRFNIAYIGIKSNPDSASFSRFPLQINSLSFRGMDGKFVLSVSFLLHLQEYATAGAGLDIHCNYVTENNRDKFKFEKISVNSIYVDFEKSGIKITGFISFFKQDEIYGNGFSGGVKFAIADPKIEASSRVLFGKINKNRYWYFDAEVQWPAPGIPLFTGVNANGFVGGAWHHLRPMKSTDNVKNTEYGLTSSGTVFVPDEGYGLGLKAGMFLNGGSDQSYIAKVVLEVQFQKSFAVSSIKIYGDIQILPEKKPSTSKDIKTVSNTVPPQGNAWDNYVKNYSPSAQIAGPFMLVMDISNKQFSANVGVFIHQAAGNCINGSGKNGRAGEISAFFSSSAWYFRVGDPLHPLSVKIKIGAFNIDAGTYFITGNQMLPSPPLPAEITQLMGKNVQSDAMRDLQKLAEGAGFAFGSNIRLQAGVGGGDKKISLYGNLLAIAGFDVNLLNYGKNTYCNGSNKPIGVNGWYANGQLYTFLQGKLGAKMGKLKIDLLTLTGAFVLTMQGPNPVYATGKSYIELSFCGYAFKGNMNFEVGEPCDMSVTAYSDTSIIIQTNPIDNSKSFDPLSPVTISFSVPINSPFFTPDGKKISFVSKTLEIKENNKSIAGTWEFNNEGTFCSFNSINPLPQNTNLQLKIQIQVTDISGPNAIPILFKGQPVEEIKIVNFITAKYPDNIPLSNIKYAYPNVNQVNFYHQESNQGYVNICKDQSYLLTQSNTKLVAKFTDINEKTIYETVCSYKNNNIVYTLPTNFIGNKIYHLRILKTDQAYTLFSPSGINASGSSGNNTSSTRPTAGSAPISGVGVVTPRSGSTKTNTIVTQVLLDYYFRCSYYGTLNNKLADLTVSSSFGVPNAADPETIQFLLTNKFNEYFEPSELEANGTIKTIALCNNSAWYTTEIKDKVYSIFSSIPSSLLLLRDTVINGYPAARSIAIHQSNISGVKLNIANVKAGIPFSFTDKNITILYALPLVVKTDFTDIQKNLVKLLVSGYPNIQIIATNWSNKLMVTSTKITLPGGGLSPTSTAPALLPAYSAVVPVPSLNPTVVSTPTTMGMPGFSALINRVQNAVYIKPTKPGNYPTSLHYFLPGKLVRNSSSKINLGYK